MRRAADSPGVRASCCLYQEENSSSNSTSSSFTQHQQQPNAPESSVQQLPDEQSDERGRLLEFVERLSSTTSSIEMQVHTNKYVSMPNSSSTQGFCILYFVLITK